MTKFSSAYLKIIILHLDTAAVVTRILMLSSRHYLVIPVHLKNLWYKQTRSESRFQTGSLSGVLEAKCIFCNCIKHNNLKVVISLDPSAEIKIQMATQKFHDDLLLKTGSYVHVSGPGFTAQEMKYHNACHQTYVSKFRLPIANNNSQLQKKTFAALLNMLASQL